jgi:hypothetical protein
MEEKRRRVTRPDSEMTTESRVFLFKYFKYQTDEMDRSERKG